jgi:hypothetical protein
MFLVFHICHENTGLLPDHLILLDVTRQMKYNYENCETNDCAACGIVRLLPLVLLPVITLQFLYQTLSKRI